LIVVEDNQGFYILEGGHRFDALCMLGSKSFPALVVKDLDSLAESNP
jgi:ParB-like chromosome segregation protein Spo0J